MINKLGSDKLNRVISVVMTVFVVGILVMYIYGQFFVHHEPLFDDECLEYTEPWFYTDEIGVTYELYAPATFSIPETETLTVWTVLPDDLSVGSCFFYRTGKSYKAYIDGELRDEYKLTKTEFGQNVKALWTKIDLHPSDAGKTMMIVKEDYPLDYCIISESYIGNRMGFLHVMFNDNKLILCVAFALVMVGSVVFFVCMIQRFFTHRVFALWYMSIGVLAGAWWIVFDNFMYPLIFGNYFIDGICEYLIVLLLPFPFMAYLNLLQERRYQVIYNMADILLIINYVLFVTLHFAGIMDFDISKTYSTIVIIIGSLVCLVTIILDIIHHSRIIHSAVTIGFAALIIMGLAEVIHVNMPNHNNDGVFVAIGMMLLLAMAIVHEVLMFNAMTVRTAKAQEANRAKSTFLANMSHEIRTPINAIVGMDELILREDINEETRGYAVNIKEASMTLLDLINDILDFSKIEQGKMELVEEEYDIASLINSVIVMIGIKAEEKQLKLVPQISSYLPSGLQGDARRIREIMINLLNNAVKYTHEGSITLSVSHENDGKGDIMLVIKVSDTGIGIKETDMDRLFSQFERLDNRRNSGIEGSGLGLAITAGFVKLLGGTIECSSTYGKGTTFTVTIPQTVTNPAPIGDIKDYVNRSVPTEPEEAKPEDKFYCNGARILVVDDNALNLKVAVRYLDAIGASRESCMSGADMLDIIKKEKFDIILLDHMMPEMDGIETLRAAKEMPDNLNKDTPVIVLTANAISGAREMYMEEGFTDYLSKPMTLDDLVAVLARHLPHGAGGGQSSDGGDHS